MPTYQERFLAIGEYMAAGLYEEEERSLFYRKALGTRRYYENRPLIEYSGELLYPSGCDKKDVTIAPHFINFDLNYELLKTKDAELAKMFGSDFYKYKSSVPKEHCVAGDMFTHSMPNYARIAKEGLYSYESRIKNIEDTDLREGLIHLLEGIKCYVKRCVEYLESVGAPDSLVNALKKVPLSPAENIYEALVSRNFVFYLDNCDNLGSITEDLLPYFKGENVVDVLKNLYDNIDANSGYSMSLGTNYSDLTIQCLEASKGKRRPMIELLVNEDTPDEVWKKAFEVVKTSNGQPAFYNEKAILDGLRKKMPYISQADVRKFCGGGCTETMLEGMTLAGSLDAGINLALIFHETILKHLPVSESFEDFYAAYIMEVSLVVDKVTAEISNSQRERSKYNPQPMRTLLIDDCIDKGVDYNAGGARYTWSIINFAGLINVIDGMLAIRDFVYANREYAPDRFAELIKNDDEKLLNTLKNHTVCFGIDNEDANEFSSKISTEIYSLLEGKKPYLGGVFLPASIQFMTAANAGKNVGATPDGRRAGAPLCDSLAAIFGKDVKGPTALLKSVTSLSLDKALGIPVLNFNVEETFDEATLKALIKSYVKLGGVQMQISCASRERLLAAYDNPEEHKNLVVRVGGYSEYFYRLSDDLKKLIIDRSIH